MPPRQLVEEWVRAFNRADADALANFYEVDAVNHQVAESPVAGREAIRRMFCEGFAAAEMVCLVENPFEDGEWAILESRDPKGLRGCGFFHVRNGRIVFQRGYWDRFSSSARTDCRFLDKDLDVSPYSTEDRGGRIVRIAR